MMTIEETLAFMQEFGVPHMNANGEMICEVEKNIYFETDKLETKADYEAAYLMAMARPIAHSLPAYRRKFHLARINDIYNTLLREEDMELIYVALCYRDNMDGMKRFIADGLPMLQIDDYRVVDDTHELV